VVCAACDDAPKRARDAGRHDATTGAAFVADASADAEGGAPVDAGPAEDALPAATSAELQTRGRHLLEAIAQDAPDLGADMLFPRDAWVASRSPPDARTDPAKQWDSKVKGAWESAIHSLHKRTKNVARAQFVSLEIGSQVQRIETSKREWSKPLWRVKKSRLTYVLEGQTHHLELAEMVGWRGAWYVTKLR
jgi:hypothetical protein